MTTTLRMLPRLLFALALTLSLASCDFLKGDGDGDGGDGATTQRFRVEIANVQGETQGAPFPVFKSGVFNTPVGADAPAPIGPGGAYEFSFSIGPNTVPGSGAQLSLATMFIQSNDLFYAFRPEGLALYGEDGAPVTGDVTDQLFLYDAGTEVNEEPGTGPNQAPRQDGPDTGEEEGGTVAFIGDGEEDAAGFTYPSVADVVQVTLAHDGGTAFTVRIENVGAEVNGQPVPLSPGAWAVHSAAISFYEVGAPASESAIGGGLEAIAEDGDPAPAAEALAPVTGITVPLSPGGYAVHTDAVQLFETGEAASQGIEDIAEDGIPAALAEMLDGLEGVRAAGAFAQPDGADANGPIGPGGSYSFEVEAEPGDRLSFATMYIQSNDFFYAFGEEGLALFDGGMPVSGDVTSSVALWDAGTEVDEEPGVGLNQIIRSAPDTGEDEDGVVTEVDGEDDGFTYPPASEIIRVTVTPL